MHHMFVIRLLLPDDTTEYSVRIGKTVHVPRYVFCCNYKVKSTRQPGLDL